MSDLSCPEFHNDVTGKMEQVNVLYVSVPKNISGGRLEMYTYSWLRAKLFPYMLSFLSTPRMDSLLPPDASLEPVENMLISFRGDTIHRVEGYRHREAGMKEGVPQYRVSLVLEQYSVPLLSYGLTTAYDLSGGTQHQYGAGKGTDGEQGEM